MNLEPGKLYRIDRWFWFLFPSLETATRAPAAAPAAVAANLASYWSKALNCNVSFMSEGDVVMVVEALGEQVGVINQEGKSGWIRFPAAEKWTKDTFIEISGDP